MFNVSIDQWRSKVSEMINLLVLAGVLVLRSETRSNHLLYFIWNDLCI